MRFYIGKFKGLRLYLTLFPDRDTDGSPSMAYHTVNAIDGISKIIINYRVLLLPKIFRQTMLLHEYGHSMFKLSQNWFPDITDKNKIEAMAHFYACCECKLHFNLWLEMIDFRFDKLHFKFKKSPKNKERMEYFENRYKDFVHHKLREEEKDIDDYVYQFYKNTQSLIFMYEGLFYTLFGAKNMKELEMYYSNGIICEDEYLYFKTNQLAIKGEAFKPFDWKAFLIKNGWNNKNERLKYINL
jgi:hypothetical protein